MLTDAKVRNAKPGAKPYKLTDSNRLFLLVMPAGGKLRRWNYAYDGKQKSTAFGVWPIVTPTSARLAPGGARPRGTANRRGEGMRCATGRYRGGVATRRRCPAGRTRHRPVRPGGARSASLDSARHALRLWRGGKSSRSFGLRLAAFLTEADFVGHLPTCFRVILGDHRIICL